MSVPVVRNFLSKKTLAIFVYSIVPILHFLHYYIINAVYINNGYGTKSNRGFDIITAGMYNQSKSADL